MKLLFDQNLSPRLPVLLGDLYEGSVHVRDVGLLEADDAILWEYAKRNNFIITTKDSDFQARSLLYGGPPKVIWLAVGNCTVQFIEGLLRKHSATLHTFARDSRKSYMRIN